MRESEMQEPLLQPIAASWSGTGSVATTSLAITTRARRSSRSAAAQALRASTILVARTEPWVVTTRGGRDRSSFVIGECSKTRTPAAIATRLRPRASLDRRGREPHGLVGSADLLQRPELRPPAEHEATVPAARSSTAHVGLDEDDVQRWIVLLQSDRGPEAREAAADDADVGALLALESRRVLGSDERLLEPEAPHEATVVDRPM